MRRLLACEQALMLEFFDDISGEGADFQTHTYHFASTLVTPYECLSPNGGRELALRLGWPPLLIPLSLPICMEYHCNTSWYPYSRCETEIAQPGDPGLDSL